MDELAIFGFIFGAIFGFLVCMYFDNQIVYVSSKKYESCVIQCATGIDKVYADGDCKCNSPKDKQ